MTYYDPSEDDKKAPKAVLLGLTLALGTLWLMLVTMGCGTITVADICKVSPQLCTPGDHPKPLPTPPPEPKPEPTPQPAIGPLINGGSWGLTSTEKFPSANRPGPRYSLVVDQAIATIYGASIGSDFTYPDVDPQVTFRRVVSQLRIMGYASGQQEPGTGDEIVVSVATDLNDVDGMHIVNYGGNKAIWSTRNGEPVDWQSGKGAFRDRWHRIEQPPIVGPGSKPEPKPDEPTTPARQVSRINVKRVGPARPVFDATPQGGPDPDFCQSIGKGRQEYCPLDGGECGEDMDPDGPTCKAIQAKREKAEKAAGPYTWKRNGRKDGRPANDPPNELQYVFPDAVAGDVIEICAANGVCGQVVMQ